MSWIVLPDEHPGRCKNLRPAVQPYTSMRRCLDYDDTPHLCVFEAEAPAPAPGAEVAFTRIDATPKPWVRPNRAEVRARHVATILDRSPELAKDLGYDVDQAEGSADG